ncbi:HIT family protein [Jeotgalicoccus halotolerans]|uniref:Histidine triad (HIT) family protein n=2 Tax=Jeotgalicoccus TaxID=227979 RepID=A0A3E0AZU6_9STAP|nr:MULTISPECIES: HIT family protein [Jeotgalicoccus]MBF0754537.1 HIT family protein [Jeotgalicoccus nanhaiensis]REG25247.1 histidine triad (HIT) family protein [Jeotgalicoccus halotolerans]TFU61057.1 HIT family protein [Jeotgalicoccus nanhaiensis]
MNKTIFEKIIDREIPANIVYEDDDVIAFMDAFPIVKGHTLVVPKQPIENIFDLDEETGAKLMSVITKVSTAVRDAFQPAGLNVVQNNGAYASQSVFHLHFHIIPRYKEEHDGFGYKWVSVEDENNTPEIRSDLEAAIKNKLNE